MNRKFEILDELGLLYEALEVAYIKYGVARNAGMTKDEALGLCDIATALDDLGSPEAALEYAIAAFDKVETLGSGNAIRHKAHNVLGTVYEGLGQNEDALINFSKALQLLPRDDFSFRASIMLQCRIGKTLFAQNKFSEAQTVLLEQRRLCRIYGFEREESYATAHLGLLAFQRGKYGLAESLLNSAYGNGERLGQLSTMAIAARGLGSLAERSGQTILALKWQEKVLSAEEAMGLRRDPLSSIKVTNVNLARDYENCIRLNCELGNFWAAFKWARKRQRHAMNAIMANPVPRLESLLDDNTRSKVSALRSEMLRLHNSMSAEGNGPSGPSNGTGTYLSNITELNRLEMQYQAVIDSQGLVRESVTTGQPSLVEMMSRLRLEKSSLINLCLGKSDLFEFVVTPDTFYCVVLNIASDSISRILHVASPLFEESQQGRSLPNPLVANVSQKALHELYDLLIRPIRPTLDRWGGLIVVSDNMLKNLPLEVLPTGASILDDVGRIRRPEFLVDKYEISYGLSTEDVFSVASRRSSKLLPVVCFGNAVSALPRPYQVPISFSSQKPSLMWVARRNHPGVIEELTHIQTIFAGEATVLTGSKGSADIFMNLASQAMILHVAAHVITNEVIPLSSGICLSDGRSDTSLTTVTVADVLGLRLNCDLAVLSGCNSGRTERNAGGGNLSAAMYRAGAQSVVSSLWEVSDTQTAKFMGRFYEYIKDGESTVSALRKAKLCMLGGDGTDLFYWGSFVLMGDRSGIQLKHPRSQAKDAVIYSSVMALITIMALLFEWKFRYVEPLGVLASNTLR